MIRVCGNPIRPGGPVWLADASGLLTAARIATSPIALARCAPFGGYTVSVLWLRDCNVTEGNVLLVDNWRPSAFSTTQFVD